MVVQKQLLTGGNVVGTVYGIEATFTDSDDNASEVTVNGGRIEGEIAGIYSKGNEIDYYREVNVTILAGTIIGGEDGGIHNGVGSILTIGKNDGTVDITSPVIIGNTEDGVYNAGTMKFYDGVIEGKSSGIYSYENEVEVPEGYRINETTEQNSEGYYVATLVKENKPTLNNISYMGGENLPTEPNDNWSNNSTLYVCDVKADLNEPYEYTLNGGHDWNDCDWGGHRGDDYWQIELTTGGQYEIQVREKSNSTNASDVYYYNFDRTVPMINVTPNSSTATTQVTPTVIITDNESGLKTNTINYIFSIETTVPTSGYQTATLVDGRVTLTSPTGVNGTYYLYIQPVEDNAGNRSNDGNVYKSGAYVFQTPTATEIRLDKSVSSLKVGEKVTISMTTTPAGAVNYTSKWKSTNSNIISVEDKGVHHDGDRQYEITALEAGNVEFYVTNEDESVTSNRCMISIQNADPDTYTITFDPQGGTVNPTSMTVTAGGRYSTLPTPTREGYLFKGWYTGENGTGENRKGGDYVRITENQTLYAYWEQETPVVTVTKVELNTPTLKLNINQEATLTATVTRSDGSTNHDVTWSVNPANIVSVDGTGKVKGVSAGTAKIRATSTEDSTQYAECTVTVENAIPLEVKVQQITITPVVVTIDLTSDTHTQQLSENVLPADATNKAVRWTSSDSTVATVSDTGLVIAIKEGTATITATAKDGSGVTATRIVTVTNSEEPEEKVTNIEITNTVKIIDLANGNTLQLSAKVEPVSAANREVIWTSNNSQVATVDENTGLVTAVKPGLVTITATAKDGSGVTATIIIEVKDTGTETKLVTGVSLDKNTITLNKGQTANLVATIEPSDASNKKWTWTSDKESVATVDQNGRITAVGEGEAVITVTTEDGGFTATCKVVVSSNGGSNNNNSGTQGGNNGGASINNGGAQKQDGSIAKTKIPQTGVSSAVLMIAVIALVNGVIIFIRYKKMNY